jgi:hypothetical protein
VLVLGYPHHGEQDEPGAERGQHAHQARQQQAAQLERLGADQVFHDRDSFEVRSKKRTDRA